MILLSRWNNDKILTFFLSVTSIFSLVLVIYLIFDKRAFVEIAFHNFIVGSAFILVCFIGAIAAIYPNKCGNIMSSRSSKQQFLHSKKTINSAHHFSCEKYSSHIFRIRKKHFCSTCSGLLIGAIAGIIGSIWYFSDFFYFDNISFLIPIGIFGVVFGLFQSIIPKMNSALIRLLAGISLVLGAYFLLINIDISNGGTFVAFFFIFISIFWILTKINLSQKEHRETCLNCAIKSCNSEDNVKS